MTNKNNKQMKYNGKNNKLRNSEKTEYAPKGAVVHNEIDNDTLIDDDELMNDTQVAEKATDTAHETVVPAEAKGLRLDRFLAQAFGDLGLSRERLKKAVEDGGLILDGELCTSPKQKVNAGQKIALTIALAPSTVAPENGDLEVLYEDEHIIVINKPAGLTVHPAPSCPQGTLVHRLLHHYPELAAQEGERPGIVHRIDKDTSGILLIARTEEARLRLIEDFAARRIHKEYLAIVRGIPALTGESTKPIGRHSTNKVRMAVQEGGKNAHSAWRVLAAGGLEGTGNDFFLADASVAKQMNCVRQAGNLDALADFVKNTAKTMPSRKKQAVFPTERNASTSLIAQGAGGLGAWALVAVRIFTGRTHQIRVHMEHEGHPLWGDALYRGLATEEELACKADLAQTAVRQMLHAWHISFDHPITGEKMEFSLPPPDDFSALLRVLMRRCQRVVLTGMPGCGKSTLLHALAQRGVPTWSADACVATLYEPNAPLWYSLRARYGDRFVPDDTAPVDKKALGAAMRSDAVLKREIEAMVHPIVQAERQDFWLAHQGAPLAVAEVPLHLELGGNSQAKGARELLVGVHAPFAVRSERLKKTRNWSDERIADIESWQWKETDKMRACDIVVNNCGTSEDLDAASDALLSRCAALRRTEEERFLQCITHIWQE